MAAIRSKDTKPEMGVRRFLWSHGFRYRLNHPRLPGKPDIVFTYTIKPNAYGGMACASLGVPYVANVTGLGTSIENGGLMQKVSLTLYKRGLRKAQKVFFQNTENRDFMVNSS